MAKTIIAIPCFLLVNSQAKSGRRKFNNRMVSFLEISRPKSFNSKCCRPKQFKSQCDDDFPDHAVILYPYTVYHETLKMKLIKVIMSQNISKQPLYDQLFYDRPL